MSFATNYFIRFNSSPTIFLDNPRSDTGIIVVIPCFNEDYLDKTLESLKNTIKPDCSIEVIVIVNSADNTPCNIVEKNQQVYEKLVENVHLGVYKSFSLLPYIIKDVPKKIAGVGNARKIGMDEALRRFNAINKKNGIVVSLDADTIVSKDYFLEIECALQNKSNGIAIFQFQHDFNLNLYSKQIIDSCKLYEIYIRYFRLVLKWTGFPYPIHTIGSCFAVKADVYAKAGGMSRRQGGEDFYFLHKTVVQTKYVNINKPIVFPSPRISDRVPFGTGPAVNQIIEDSEYKVYNFELFVILEKFFKTFELLFKDLERYFEFIPYEIINYFSESKLKEIVYECKKNTSNLDSFIKRMFTKFDAFQIIKFLNSFDNDSVYSPQEVIDATKSYLIMREIDFSENDDLNGIYSTIYNLDLKT